MLKHQLQMTFSHWCCSLYVFRHSFWLCGSTFQASKQHNCIPEQTSFSCLLFNMLGQAKRNLSWIYGSNESCFHLSSPTSSSTGTVQVGTLCHVDSGPRLFFYTSQVISEACVVCICTCLITRAGSHYAPDLESLSTAAAMSG